MSGGWNGSVWTEAGQVRALLGWPPAPELDVLALHECFARLRQRRRLTDAACFLAVALPRYEAVLWATRTVHDRAAMTDRSAMDAVVAWLRDPSEPRRRAAEVVARTMRRPAPEPLCAWAAFMAGGSVAPVDAAPLLAPADATGRFAAAAVITTVAPFGAGVLHEALDAGIRMALTRDYDR